MYALRCAVGWIHILDGRDDSGNSEGAPSHPSNTPYGVVSGKRQGNYCHAHGPLRSTLSEIHTMANLIDMILAADIGRSTRDGRAGNKSQRICYLIFASMHDLRTFLQPLQLTSGNNLSDDSNFP